MTEPRAPVHPEAADLQRYADGEAEGGQDAALRAHVESCPQCRAEVERVRRVTAGLALTSRAPEMLGEQVRARRAAGDRILLPVPPRRGARSSWRIFALPIGAAAAAALTLFAVQAWRDTRAAEPKTPVVAEDERLLFVATVRARQEPAIDSAAAVARREPAATVRLRYADEGMQRADARRLADSVASDLVGRGFSAERITVQPVPPRERSRVPLAPGAVEISVSEKDRAKCEPNC